MSAKETPLSKSATHKVRHYVDDDGVRRFRIGSKLFTYHEAYVAILAESGGKFDPVKGSRYTPASIRRLGLLNDAYQSAARQFIAEASARRAAEKAKKEREVTDQLNPPPANEPTPAP